MFASGEKMLQCPPRPMAMDTRWKTRVEIAPNCPRCASSNTKFCYYNNYSLSQPRYFCKDCRRYWTKGGSLRNVPVGGGCRKNRRSKSVRLPTTERVTSSYLSRDDPLGNSSSSIGYSTVPVTATDVSNIDLAVVFAKFLNENSCLDSEPVVPPELASEVNASFNLIPNHESPAVRFPEEQNMIECQRLLELAPDAQLIGGSSHVFPGEFGLMNKQHDQDRVPQFTGSYPNDYGFQPIFSDEIVEAALWSDAPAIPNFAWQASQLHGLESVPSVADDHFTLHSNPLNDNWSSFDLSSYGDLSRS